MGGVLKFGPWGQGALLAVLLNLICYLVPAAADSGSKLSESWHGLRGNEVQMLVPASTAQSEKEQTPVVQINSSVPEVVVASQDNPSQLAATLRLTPTTELKLSFLYRQDQSGSNFGPSGSSHLLMQYSVDYLVMPNLRVGLYGYLYKPSTEYQYWRPFQPETPQLGFGPGLKYDLGRWSFLLRSQMESGTKDRKESLHNWFRVWYSF